MRSLQNVDMANLPQIELKHFEKALTAVAPSVSKELLAKYETWEGRSS
jgi:SpoVK/Ycf46/Vps4 family AAA+-type ATPase